MGSGLGAIDLAFHEKATAGGGAGLRFPSCENDDDDDDDDEVLGLAVFSDDDTGNAPAPCFTRDRLSNRSISGRTAAAALLLLLLPLLNPNEWDEGR